MKYIRCSGLFTYAVFKVQHSKEYRARPGRTTPSAGRIGHLSYGEYGEQKLIVPALSGCYSVWIGALHLWNIFTAPQKYVFYTLYIGVIV